MSLELGSSCFHGRPREEDCSECCVVPRLLTRKRLCKLTALLYSSGQLEGRAGAAMTWQRIMHVVIARKGVSDTIGMMGEERHAVNRSCVLAITAISLLADAAKADPGLFPAGTPDALRAAADAKAMRGVVGYDAWQNLTPVGGGIRPRSYRSSVRREARFLTDVLTRAATWMVANWSPEMMMRDSPWEDVIVEGDLADIALTDEAVLPIDTLRPVLTPMELDFVEEKRRGLRWNRHHRLTTQALELLELVEAARTGSDTEPFDEEGRRALTLSARMVVLDDGFAGEAAATRRRSSHRSSHRSSQQHRAEEDAEDEE